MQNAKKRISEIEAELREENEIFDTGITSESAIRSEARRRFLSERREADERRINLEKARKFLDKECPGKSLSEIIQTANEEIREIRSFLYENAMFLHDAFEDYFEKRIDYSVYRALIKEPKKMEKKALKRSEFLDKLRSSAAFLCRF